MRRTAVALGVLLLLVLGMASLAMSGEEKSKTLSPYFFVEGDDPAIDRLPLKHTDVDVRITGVMADVVVTQVYRNEGTRPIHARYIFPASTRAAVHGMTLTIGERIVRAQIKEREAAQRQYEQAKSEGKSAALLQQQRPNVFSMNVANILPQDEVRVELHYSELLVPADGTYEFVYPTVVGPRYSSQAEETAPEGDRWVKSPYLRQGEPPRSTLDLKVRIAAGIPLQDVACTSHRTAVDWPDPTTALVRLDPAEATGGNRDFILRYRLEGEQVQSGLLLYPGEKENFFLLMVQPPDRVAAEKVPPREYIFVVDVSGSMHGFPLDTAKRLLRDLIGGLRPQDSFNLILFAGGSQQMAPHSLPATPENIRQAIALIDEQQGGGGTELCEALRQAYAVPGDADGQSRSMILVTDGFISAEREVFELIGKNLNRANLFAFGIGSSVNRYLIEGVARAGQGEPFVVSAPGEAPSVAGRFRDYVQSPVLTGIKVDFDGFDVYDLEPAAIPDLFAARPVLVFGKWRGPAKGTITLSGSGGTGAYRKTFDVRQAKAAPDNRALQYLWARTRLARLSDYNTADPVEETKAEIINLGLTYNLLTAHTSFIAVHEVVRNTEGGKEVKQPLPLPQGVSDLAVGGTSVPEPALLPLLALLLLLSLASARGRQRWARFLAGGAGREGSRR